MYAFGEVRMNWVCQWVYILMCAGRAGERWWSGLAGDAY